MKKVIINPDRIALYYLLATLVTGLLLIILFLIIGI